MMPAVEPAAVAARRSAEDASDVLSGRWLADESAFDVLGDRWDALAAGSGRPSLCNGLAWGRAWWRTFGGGDRRLAVYACWRDDALVGIAPFVTTRLRVRAYSPFLLRALLVLGTGEPDADDVASEYADALVAPGFEAQFAAQLSQALIHGPGAPRWDVACMYNQLDGAIHLDQVLPALRRLGCGTTLGQAGLRYVIGLPGDWDGFLGSLGAGFRAKLRTDRRRLSKLGVMSVEIFEGEAAARVGWPRLAALHTARWRDKGSDGAFASPAFGRFHAALLASAGGPSRGEILVVTLDGRDLAAVYTLHACSTVYYYQSGYDARLAPNVSLGAFVIGLAIERAIGSGAERFDLMKGGVQSYKARYGALEVPMWHATVFAPTLHGRLARRWAAGVEAVRALRDRA